MISIFWDVKQCGPFKLNRRFGRTYHLNLQGKNTPSKKRESKQVASLWLAGNHHHHHHQLKDLNVLICFYLRG
jgi:hypothetical protein